MAANLAMPIHSIDSCEFCNSKENLKRCARCKTVLYCSRDHQKKDWLNHKSVCKLSLHESYDSANRSEHVRASEVNSNSERDRADTETEKSVEERKKLSQQAEIESILDFSSITAPACCETPEETETNKIIFQDLIQSQSESYTGPSDNTDTPEFNGSIDQKLVPEVNNIICADENNVSDDNDLVPFDTRPLRRLKFPKPDSYAHPDLAEFISLRLTNLGYCIVDGVFDEETIDGVISEAKNLSRSDEMQPGQLGGGRSSGDDSKKVTEMNIRSDKIKWLEGNEEHLPYAGKALATLDSIMSFINPHLKTYGFIQGRTKAMLGCYPGNGTYYRRHIDNPRRDGRRITCLLYLNKDWEVQKDGGLLLRILQPTQDKPVDVPPLANRLLFFWSDKRNPHEVQPTFKERFALTVWYFDAEERESAKVEEIKQETAEISAQINRLEERKKKIEEETQAQEIENKAMEAVRALSPQELQAISMLVHTHPNAREILRGMGISDIIQEALLKFISTQH